MKTYLLKTYDSTTMMGLVFSSGALLLIMRILLASYYENIPGFFIMFVIVFFFYISYKLSEGEISITLTSEGILKIRTEEKPIIGDFENTYISLSDIESYAYSWSRMSRFLRIYLYNTKKIELFHVITKKTKPIFMREKTFYKNSLTLEGFDQLVKPNKIYSRFVFKAWLEIFLK
jgi:hypothetical protein